MLLLLDIGGTNLRLSTSTDGRTFATPTIVPTPQTFDDAITTITTHGHKLTDDQPITQTIIALPGILNADHSALAASPNIAKWAKQPLKHTLEKELQTTVHLANDAAVAGLAEATYGAGQGHDIVAYVTVSTGIGGARIVRGRIDDSVTGFEPGHQIIDASGTLCPECPTPSTLEDLVGGASVERRYHIKPQHITDQSVWPTLARYLAFGLKNMAALWSPRIITLGGPMMRDIKVDDIRRELAAVKRPLPFLPIIEPATLPDDQRAFYGALALAKSFEDE